MPLLLLISKVLDGASGPRLCVGTVYTSGTGKFKATHTGPPAALPLLLSNNNPP
jgi:hypothetical protein